MQYGKVTLLADNQVPAWVASPAAATGFEDDHLTDGNETTLWKATSSADQTLTYDQGTAKISEFATSVFDAGATNPRGVTYSPNDTLWIVDSNTNKIYNIETDGTLISSFATSVFDAGATFTTGIDIAPNGTLWVCDIAVTDEVYNIKTDGSFASSGIITAFSDYSGTVAGTVKVTSSAAHGLTTGDRRSIKGTTNYNGSYIITTLDTVTYYITHSWDGDDATGTWESSFPTSVFGASANGPRGIAIALNSTIWTCDTNTNKIYNVEMNGALISEFDVTGFASGPSDISYSLDNTLWFCDSSNIYNVKTDGELISSFPTSVFDASATTTSGISRSPDGTLWVCDSNTDKIYNSKILLAFDSLFITGHNLNSINSLVKWQYSDDGAAWITMEYEFTPVDDKSIGIRLASTRTTRAVRIVLSSMTAAAQISIAIVTRKQEIDFADLYDPHRVRRDRRVNRTLNGQTSDVTDYFQEHILEFKFSTINESVYQIVKDYFDDNPNDVIGVYWEPDFHPHQLWAMELDQDEFNAPYIVTGIKRDVSVRLRGLVE
jgi:sugar lactone lactonase YvrE